MHPNKFRNNRWNFHRKFESYRIPYRVYSSVFLFYYFLIGLFVSLREVCGFIKRKWFLRYFRRFDWPRHLGFLKSNVCEVKKKKKKNHEGICESYSRFFHYSNASTRNCENLKYKSTVTFCELKSSWEIGKFYVLKQFGTSRRDKWLALNERESVALTSSWKLL